MPPCGPPAVRGDGGRGRGVALRGPCPRWSKAAGRAVLGWQDALGGLGRLPRVWPQPPVPLSTMCDEGTWIGAFAGLTRTCGGCDGYIRVRVMGRCLAWASLPGAAGFGRAGIGSEWRSPRHTAGADLAPGRGWPGVRQHPVPDGAAIADGHADDRCTGRRGVAPDRGGQMGGTQSVLTRCPRGGTRTARPRRAQGGVGSLLTRCQMGGTQTVLTRRLGRGGRGYVSTRCPRGGTRTVRPRRAQGGVGSLLTRCQMGGTQTVTDPALSAVVAERVRPCTRCLQLGGGATVVRKHAMMPRAFPCTGRCPVLQESLATANPGQWVHIGGGGRKTTAASVVSG